MPSSPPTDHSGIALFRTVGDEVGYHYLTLPQFFDQASSTGNNSFSNLDSATTKPVDAG
jgi:hypothetical protein